MGHRQVYPEHRDFRSNFYRCGYERYNRFEIKEDQIKICSYEILANNLCQNERWIDILPIGSCDTIIKLLIYILEPFTNG